MRFGTGLDMRRKGRKIMRIFLYAAVFLPLFFSCSLNGSQKSFISTLDAIDVLIAQHQYKEAEQELAKAEKKAFGSWAQLGIFRRYSQMGADSRAENVLVRAVKNNPDNEELLAVYTHFLLRAGKREEALSVGKKLAGTKYGSVYSEAVFEETLLKSDGTLLTDVCVSPEYIPVYYDAYTGSKDNSWLRNCALIQLSRGAYEEAVRFRPQELSDRRDAYFWAAVLYDAGRFGDAVNYAETARMFCDSLLHDGTAADENDVLLLEADAYTMLHDAESAEKIRQHCISSFRREKDGWILPDGGKDARFAVLFTNCAQWAWDNCNDSDCARYLFFAVNTWRDFTPALALYAQFAYESSLQPPEDTVRLEIREAGTTTLEMEQFDNKARIPVSDAAARISESLSRTHDPLLYVVSLDLKYKTVSSLSEKDKITDLWRVLEGNALSPGIYPDVLSDYAVSFLLRNKQTEDAWQFFKNSICRKYSLSAGDGFWNELYENRAVMMRKELEYAGYFAASFHRADDAVRLYEAACFGTDSSIEKGALSLFVSDNSCINLAMIYHSLGRSKDALDLYGKTAGRCAAVRKKSLILYRIALIYYADGDIKNARRSAEYAVSLDSKNAEARLLLARIKMQ